MIYENEKEHIEFSKGQLDDMVKGYPYIYKDLSTDEPYYADASFIRAIYNIPTTGMHQILDSAYNAKQNVLYMIIDGDDEHPVSAATSYNFTKIGRHEIKFVMPHHSPVVSGMFHNGCATLIGLSFYDFDSSEVVRGDYKNLLGYIDHNTNTPNNVVGIYGEQTLQNITDFNNIFVGTQVKGLDVATWIQPKGVVTSAFRDNKQLVYVNGLENWNTSTVTAMQQMFAACENLQSLSTIANWNMSNVTDISYMLDGCTHLTTIGDVSNWYSNSSKLSTTEGAFRNCYVLTSVGNLKDWNVSNVTTMKGMFDGCQQIKSFGNINSWNTSKVSNMEALFNNCPSMSSYNIDNWDVSNVATMQNMFSVNTSLTTLNGLSKWQPKVLANTSYMFQGCSNLKTIDSVSSLGQYGNITTTQQMFTGCVNLSSIGDLSSWRLSKLTNAEGMFQQCESLTSIGNTKDWGISTALTITARMFSACYQLTSLGDLSNWDMSSVTDMAFMFNGCQSLNGLNSLENWDVSSVQNMERLFSGCYQLTSIDLSQWDMSNVTTISLMFNGCSQLKTIKMGGNLTKLTEVSNMFLNVPNSSDCKFYYNSNEPKYVQVLNQLPSNWQKIPL